MTHGEQRIYLIKELLAEDERYKGCLLYTSTGVISI